jgi:hypothetical protein
MADIENQWFGFVDRLYAVGNDIAENIRLEDPENAPVLGAALLMRTLAHIRATVILLRNDCIVEARTITRCCFENSLFVAALAREGEKFVQDMKNQELSMRKSRGELLIRDTADQPEHAGKVELREYLRQIANEIDKRPSLDPKGVSLRGSLALSYNFYARLSADAAHPTFTSLDRHIDKLLSGDSKGFSVNPVCEPDEGADTLALLAQAVIGVLIGVNEMWAQPKEAEAMNELLAEFSRLGEEGLDR